MTTPSLCKTQTPRLRSPIFFSIKPPPLLLLPPPRPPMWPRPNLPQRNRGPLSMPAQFNAPLAPAVLWPQLHRRSLPTIPRSVLLARRRRRRRRWISPRRSPLLRLRLKPHCRRHLPRRAGAAVQVVQATQAGPAARRQKCASPSLA